MPETPYTLLDALPEDYSKGRAQKAVEAAAREGDPVPYVDMSKWERIARSEGKPGGYGFIWWWIGVAVITVVAVSAAQ